MRRSGFPGAVAVALPVAVLAAYWPALSGALVWDDDAHVTRAALRTVHGLWRIWSEPGATQQYYPFLHSAFWVEHRLWGDATLGYHLVNLLFHLGAVLLLYRVLRRLEVPGALLGASLFALHPVCAETVAWISEQKNTLCAVLYLAAALAYLRFDAERRWRWYALGAGCFTLAVLSKSVAATLPAALLVVAWWRRGALSWRADVAPLAPWLCLGAASGALTAWVERTFVGATGPAFALGAAERLLVAGRALWFYLAKILWPADLVFIYPRWTLDAHSPGQYLYPAAAAAALAALYAARGRSRGPLAAALLFAGTLVPALGFFNVYPFVFSYVADHFQYLAAASMIPALAAGLALAAGRLPARLAPAARVAAVCIAAALAGLTWRQSANYRDPETFYRSILRRNPASWLAHDNLGVVLAQSGRAREASQHYLEAMRLNPDYPEAFNNYGNVLAEQGRWDEAAKAYAAALRARPSFAAAEKNWGKAMSDAGRPGEAELHFRRALLILPDYAEAHYGLGNVFGNTGRLAEAVGEYEKALKLEPDSPEVHANLGLALAEEGRWGEALSQVAEAVRLRPGYAEAHAYYGFALAGSGRLEQALDEYRQALRVGPDNADVHYQMGSVLSRLGRADEAKAEFDAARRLSAPR